MGGARRGRLFFLILLVALTALNHQAFTRTDDEHARLSGALYPYELQAYDLLVRSLGTQAWDDRLRIVGVDDTSLQEDCLGPWPWNRGVQARLLQILRENGAATAGFDFLFVENLDAGTQAFVKELGAFGKGVLSSKLAQNGMGSEEKALLPLPELARAAAGVGYINVNTTDDLHSAKLRRTTLATRVGNGWQYSFDLLVYATSRGLTSRDISVEANGVRVGAELIPTNERQELLINYYRETVTDSATVVHLADIPYWRMIGVPPPAGYVGTTVAPSRALIENGVFLMGVWDTTVLGDVVETPVGRYPGVAVHAEIINTMMRQAFIRESRPWVDALLLLVLPLALAWIFQRVNGVFVLLTAFGVMGGLVGSAVVLFKHGWWIRVLGPSVAVFSTALLVVIYQFIRSHMLLRQFITPELAHDLLLAEGANAHTTEQDCTVIFSDIRGFTTLNEQMPPTRMVELLKEYHTLTVPIYERHGGRCLDYLGDAQMVVYGDPMSLRRAREKNHAVAALTAGLEVHEAIEAMNARWVERGDPPFDVGIGACSGVVAVGVLGADTAHLQYTVIGDVTNTAARVQGLSRDLRAPVICTQSTADRAGDRLVTERIESVSLKGKAKEVVVHRVLGVSGDARGIERMRAATAESAVTG